MLKPDKTHADTFASRMGDAKKKARRLPIAVIAMLLLGLAVGGWFAIDDWLAGETLPAAIKGTALAVAVAVMTAAGSAGRSCGDCRLKNFFSRVKG